MYARAGFRAANSTDSRVQARTAPQNRRQKPLQTRATGNAVIIPDPVHQTHTHPIDPGQRENDARRRRRSSASSYRIEDAARSSARCLDHLVMAACLGFPGMRAWAVTLES